MVQSYQEADRSPRGKRCAGLTGAPSPPRGEEPVVQLLRRAGAGVRGGQNAQIRAGPDHLADSGGVVEARPRPLGRAAGELVRSALAAPIAGAVRGNGAGVMAERGVHAGGGRVLVEYSTFAGRSAAAGSARDRGDQTGRHGRGRGGGARGGEGGRYVGLQGRRRVTGDRGKSRGGNSRGGRGRNGRGRRAGRGGQRRRAEGAAVVLAAAGGAPGPRCSSAARRCAAGENSP